MSVVGPEKGGGKKHEIYTVAFGGYLFFYIIVTGPAGPFMHGPLPGQRCCYINPNTHTPVQESMTKNETLDSSQI